MNCPVCDVSMKQMQKYCSNCGEVSSLHGKETAPQATSTTPIRDFGTAFLIVVALGALGLLVHFSEDVSTPSAQVPLPEPSGYFSDDEQMFELNDVGNYPSNGTVLKRNNQFLSEYGQLRVENGTEHDAMVKLVRDGSAIFSVYISANSEYTITDISDGRYWLMFSYGEGWDSESLNFQSNIRSSAFEEVFDFVTTETYYPGFEVSLHSVANGTANTVYVDPIQFNAY